MMMTTLLIGVLECWNTGIMSGGLANSPTFQYSIFPPFQCSEPVTATNRPMRNRQTAVLTVGQTEGDLQGKDDKIIQAGIEYLNRLGGGTLRLLPGTYLLHNAVYLRPNITLQGSGAATILRKAESVVTPLARDSDWFEYGAAVKDATGFTPGGGIMLRSKTGPGDWQFDVLRATITAIQGNVLFLDRLTLKDFWTDKDATAATIFPLLTAENVDDVTVKDLVLDGNRAKNEHINGNFSGAVFIQQCNRWRFENVTARDYNGDGFSFQVCDDIQFQNCQAMNNADLGFHPGSGSQRPAFRNCTAQGNSLGLYFCWAVSDGLAENCTLSENQAIRRQHRASRHGQRHQELHDRTQRRSGNPVPQRGRRIPRRPSQSDRELRGPGHRPGQAGHRHRHPGQDAGHHHLQHEDREHAPAASRRRASASAKRAQRIYNAFQGQHHSGRKSPTPVGGPAAARIPSEIKVSHQLLPAAAPVPLANGDDGKLGAGGPGGAEHDATFAGRQSRG